MPQLDPRVDAYLSGAPDFARPILERLRQDVHQACPDVVETLKWSRPHFLLHDRILCGMSAFKAHCAFGFWQREGAEPGQPGAMGDLGRITSLADLPPPAELARRIRAAAALLQAGAPRAARPTRGPRPTLSMPDDLAAALAANPAARQHYQAFAPSKQRDYLEWVLEAKREDTRARRIAQAVAWLAEGKSRNWKYEGC
ncbi:MAG: hypothetical protein DI603_18545 [Roseateles depolymerans]|uniref:YdhG-like domain-containing protein n=1 Tax=Roseateles depolymerans TaxID=76731 RepID=A0A2W5DE56_9BURK|nr:MAG: hypothetical protein DI603_18545 [Roseateles depolymerans]